MKGRRRGILRVSVLCDLTGATMCMAAAAQRFPWFGEMVSTGRCVAMSRKEEVPGTQSNFDLLLLPLRSTKAS